MENFIFCEVTTDGDGSVDYLFFLVIAPLIALTFPSLVLIFSTILPILYDLFSKSSLIWTTSPILGKLLVFIFGDSNFNFSCSCRFNS